MLTFGKIRERVEEVAGMTISASTLAGWIDEAQIEISKHFGKRVGKWYPPDETKTAEEISKDDTQITVVDATRLPPAPAEVRLGYGPKAEMIRYESTLGHTLTDVIRGIGSEPRNWPEGTGVSLKEVGGVEYDLPEDCFQVHEVRDIHNVPAFAYQITEQLNITYFQQEPFKLIYTKVPEPINYENSESVPEVHSVFHPVIITYCLSKHWESIADGLPEEENKAHALMSKFYSTVEDKARVLAGNVNQQYEIHFELW